MIKLFWRRRSKGFTLIELLVVIAIIGILATIVLMAITGGRDRAKKNSFKKEVAALKNPLILICDERVITTADFPNGGADSNVVAWSGASIASQDCGPQWSNMFTITNIRPTGTIPGCTDATLTQSGADFTNCP